MTWEENLVTDVETFYFCDMFLYPKASRDGSRGVKLTG